MKLETKLGISSGAIIVAMFLTAIIAHRKIVDGARIANQTLTVQMPFMLQVVSVRGHVNRATVALESYMLFGVDERASQRFRQEVAAQMREADEGLRDLEVLRLSLNLGEDGRRLTRLEETAAHLKTVEQQVIDLNESKSPEKIAQAYTLVQQDLLTLDRDLYNGAMEISESQRRQMGTEVAHLQQANRLTLVMLWAATLLGALIGGGVSMLLGRHISRAIELVVSRANAIAAGDLSGEELRLETHDQIGALAEAMNRMQHALGSIIGTVAETAGSLTGSAASMRSASDQIHRRIDQQSQQTQQAATAMQEMSASIAEVSRHTQSAAETARGAAQTARDGGTIVKQMLGSMQQIATAVSDTSETVGLLGEDSKRISQIVTVIDEIARKTNLLALNAAIEAARAGEQGRGFAVVAGEVRRLAESTAQATSEIAAMIHEIQDRTRIAIASMESGTSTVQQGVITTTQAGEALERIIGMAERVDRMITQIAIATSQQATAADQSSASLDSIHTLSHDNLSEMATTAAGIEGLRGTAVKLEKQVDRFSVQALAAA